MSGLVVGRRGRWIAHLGALVIEHRPSLDQLDAESAMAADEVIAIAISARMFPATIFHHPSASAPTIHKRNETDKEDLEHCQ